MLMSGLKLRSTCSCMNLSTYLTRRFVEPLLPEHPTPSQAVSHTSPVQLEPDKTQGLKRSESCDLRLFLCDSSGARTSGP